MNKKTPSIIALIPARSGSKRVPGKNIHMLAGHPLIAYTICAARQSGIFSDIFVSTDSEEYAEISRQYGAEVPFLRPVDISGDLALDIEWVDFMLHKLKEMGREYDCFSILRPTSPFRLPTTIQRAWMEFLNEDGVDSLRAVEKVKEHPGKMWVIRGNRMMPLLPFGPKEQPWHSTPYQGLPEVYSQNASLEMAWTRVVFNGRTIAGNVVMPFFTEGYEGLDVNRPYDWELAERLVTRGVAELPGVSKEG
jgi:CMP-N,N'-diacetyllegionaminic acid synthase